MLGILPFFQLYFVGQAFNSLQTYLENGQESLVDEIILNFVLSIIFNVAETFLWQFNEYFNRMTWFNWHEHMSVVVPRKFASLDLEKHEDSKFNNLIIKVDRGYSYEPSNFAETLIWAIYQLVQVIASIGILFTSSWWLMPVIIISLAQNL